ncbi:unnamed protein product [Larinioides sclopetarius]|uniref:Cullin-2 n=1 Tax=Larinioides sclopetarius TaxID=280406 RepID=A0AAV2B8E6_9ARAC
MSLGSKCVDFDETWSRLRERIDRVITLRKVDRLEWSDCFNDVYALCIACPKSLAKKLYDVTETHLHQHVQKLYKEIVSSDEELLVAYYKRWLEFSQGNHFLQWLYFYLNTQHVVKQKFSRECRERYASEDVMMTTGELGLEIWKTTVIEPLQSKVVHLLLDGIRLDRHGICTNQSVFHGIIQSFVKVEENKTKNQLEFYQEIFENHFLKATSEFYQLEVSRLLEENNCSQYMEKVLHKLHEEDLRSRKYLHPSSYGRVRQVCEQCLVIDQLNFLQGECKRMVEEENKKDLKNLYILLKSNPSAAETLLQEFQQHITKNAFEVIHNITGDNIPQEFVESLMAVHDKFSSFILTVFSGDHRFIGALDKACITVINHERSPKHISRSPELLVKYCDSLLKKNAKACSENEVENKLTRAITVFKYIDGKDFFQKFYSKMMAKRIIYNQSMSMDAEEAMINKLKEICGHEFTYKLHSIFTDASVSIDLNSRFIESLRDKNIQLDINFSVSVFQTGSWPLGQSAVSTLAIPQEFEKCIQQFESFYGSRFKGRRLKWLHHLSDAEVKLCYLKKTYIVRMSTYQMAILLLYKRADVLSYQEILEITNLSDEQLSKLIKSLLDSKLILASDSENTIKAGSTFSLNKEYSNKRTKFRISAVVQKESTQQEVQKTHASVERDRKAYLQAAIVRIMKSRKVLRHNILIQEVINQARYRFTPNVPMIKKCIEQLIEQEYIERTQNFTDEYSYVA